MSQTFEVCIACNHPIGQHFQSVDGKVRCLRTERGVTTGIIMEYDHMCDCVDYHSEEAEIKTAKRKAEEAERDEIIRQILDAAMGTAVSGEEEPNA